MTSALRNEPFQCSNLIDILYEPYPYAGNILEQALTVNEIASSLFEHSFDCCAFVLDLAHRILQLVLAAALAIPLINVVVLKVLRLFNVSYVREGTLPHEWDAIFREMSNRGEVLIREEMELSLATVLDTEYSQRKQTVLDDLADPDAFQLENIRCTDEICRFDLDAVLARFRTDYPHRNLEQFFGYAGIGYSQRIGMSGYLGRYDRNDDGAQETIVKNCFSRLYDFLMQKKALFQHSPKEDLFKAEIRHIFDQIRDAHHNCIDQVGSQVESIMIRTIASYEMARGSRSQNRGAKLRAMAACALFEHKLQLIREICVKEYPNESHFVVIEREAKRILAEDLGLTGDIVQAGAHYSSMIRDMENKARNVAEIFLHGRPLEAFRRANRRYEEDQYRPEEFFSKGLRTFEGHLRTLRNDIMLWMRSYFNVGAEDELTQLFVQAISEDDTFTAEDGGNLEPEALVCLLKTFGIFERRPNAAV